VGTLIWEVMGICCNGDVSLCHGQVNQLCMVGQAIAGKHPSCNSRSSWGSYSKIEEGGLETFGNETNMKPRSDKVQ